MVVVLEDKLIVRRVEVDLRLTGPGDAGVVARQVVLLVDDVDQVPPPHLAHPDRRLEPRVADAPLAFQQGVDELLHVAEDLRPQQHVRPRDEVVVEAHRHGGGQEPEDDARGDDPAEVHAGGLHGRHLVVRRQPAVDNAGGEQRRRRNRERQRARHQQRDDQ